MGEKDEKRKPDDPEQSKRFEETAKRLDTDESGNIFEKAMEVITSKMDKDSPISQQEKEDSRR